MPPTEIREKPQELVGQPGELNASMQITFSSELGHTWHLVQGSIQPQTNAPGFAITVFTPMHEVKFSENLWAKLDQLSAQTPDPVADEDDDL